MSDSTSFPALSSSSSSLLPIEMRHFRAPNNSLEPTRPAAAKRVYDRFQGLAGRLISKPLGGAIDAVVTEPVRIFGCKIFKKLCCC
jgi:hypothetical protein